MAKYGTHKGKKGKHTFVMITHTMFDSDAYRDLSTNARCTLHEILRRFNGYNNGNISISARELAQKLHIGKSTACKNIDELIQKGFIIVTEEAGFNQKTGNRARRFALTSHPIKKNNGQTISASNKWREYKK